MQPAGFGDPVEPSPELAARYVERGWWNGDTLQTILASGLASSARLPFVVHSKQRPFTGAVGDVAAVAGRLSEGLRELGVGPGDVVAFHLPNWMEAAAAFWGLTARGTTLLPIPHFYGPHELRLILAESGARVLIMASRFGSRDHLAEVEAMRDELPQLETIVVIGDGPCPPWARPFDDVLGAGGHPPDPAAARAPADPAVVAYTSGTGAAPKGVVLTHRALAFDTTFHLGQATRGGPRPLLNGSPVTHVAGMLISLLVPPVFAGPIHLIDVWDPAVVLAAMRTFDLTSGSGAAFFLTSLVDHPDATPEDLARIGRVTLGGSPVPSALVERVEAQGIWVGRSYGSTEQPTMSFTTADDPLERRMTTNGRPMIGVEMKVVDPEGNEVPRGVAGELLSRGPDRSSGYLDPAATASTFDRDGWLHTGDIGIIDRDGYVLITDRIKDIIIRGGENISAAEVEEALLRSPAFTEVAVVAAPDPRYGERACAFVRARPGAPPPDLEAVRRQMAAAGLARQKWPEEVRAVDELPRTPSGKIKKSVLRDQLRAEAGQSEH